MWHELIWEPGILHRTRHPEKILSVVQLNIRTFCPQGNVVTGQKNGKYVIKILVRQWWCGNYTDILAANVDFQNGLFWILNRTKTCMFSYYELGHQNTSFICSGPLCRVWQPNVAHQSNSILRYIYIFLTITFFWFCLVNKTKKAAAMYVKLIPA